MNFKPKSWIWWLTYPIAHPTSKFCTLIGHTLYCPVGYTPSTRLVAHENIHIEQMSKVGMFKYYFLYLFCLPLFYNPWRKKWELEAYIEGSGLSKEQVLKKLKTINYGWV